MRVRLLDPAGTKLSLDADQVKLFRRESVKARRERPKKGVARGVAPDCEIRVTDRGRTRTFELYGQSVLHDPAQNLTWQFYFGFVLLGWLEAARVPAAPPP